MSYVRRSFLTKAGWLLLAGLLLLTGTGRSWAAEQPNIEQLMPAAGGALVHAGQKDWPQAAKELEQFEAIWKMLQPPASALVDQVNAAMSEAELALRDAENKPDAAYQAFSKLTVATNAYVTAQQAGGSKPDGKEAVKTLLPALQQTLEALRQDQPSKVKSEFKRFDGQWSKAEAAIRSDNVGAYGDIETKISLARISLQAEPLQVEAAAAGVTDLIKSLEAYANGANKQTTGESDTHSIVDALQLLQNAQGAIRSGKYAEAAKDMQSFVRLWPSVEVAVQTRAPDVYTRIENEMTEASGYLLSNPVKGEKAASVIANMQLELEPFKSSVSYSAMDAALILLREGVEALLVLAALLAFLQRSGNASKQKWVWGGAAAGLLASIALAIVLTLAIASVSSGSTRETLEGITGLVAVVMLLTVGVWLHGKSQVKAWNQYIQGQVGSALATGSLWSLGVVSGLAILREGAETTIFYIGIAPSIEPLQLILGIGGALAVLVLLGYAMIKGSVRLPLRPFFLTATVLIYYLVVKFLGQSIHALQVSGHLPAHTSTHIPDISWLGVYPTWESTAPQLAALSFIFYQWMKPRLHPLASSEIARDS